MSWRGFLGTLFVVVGLRAITPVRGWPLIIGTTLVCLGLDVLYEERGR